MGKYSILVKKSAVKELEKVPQPDLRRIAGKIQNLAIDPRPVGSQKLSSFELYRIRQGDYRIIYSIDDTEILIEIIKIGHRRDIYKF
ncbi:MAG: addiction module antitoxin [Elusimicrobia bacterium RIFOXYB2_FULL_50_12]|nr:MAG: addiction module antitoxin [Elusimicrobia bacterium RIFOXYB2_FULL_50_12]